MAILATHAGAAVVNARLLDQLREANKAKDDFFSTLSHELRAPLTPILGWTHLLKPFAGLDPLLAQGVDIIERNARQLSELIRDLLDLTRIISNKVELERTPTDLTALVRTVVAQMLPQAEARAITVELTLPDETIVGNVDPIRVQQIVSNLLGNAVKFTPEGGQASVVLKRDPGGASNPPGVVIEFIDTGIGIESDFLPFVFERFTQAHEGIDRRFGGLGLGLAISRAMVELHGGRVTAKSGGPGSGSTFTVTLPIALDCRADAEDHSSESVADEREVQNLQLRVLLIDDSVDTLNMLSLWLSTFGCQVLIATEATEGVKVATEQHPNLIISDIGMPDVDGYELMRLLRRTPGLEQVPAIALTGYARDEDRELALAAGYDAHIPKPANMERLLYLIRKLTRDKQS
jgi:CheY-like chemotaxis protein